MSIYGNIIINENKDQDKARRFIKEVKDLAEKYDLSVFVVTEGASGIRNNNCPAVKHARDCHIEWEKENGHDPYEDWGNNKKYK